MEFNFLAAILSVFVVVIEGLASWREKTFSPFQRGGCKKIKLYFLYHGAVVAGDLIILSCLFGIWFNHYSIPWSVWLIFFLISLFITWKCHQGWWHGCKDQPGFMYPDQDASAGQAEYWYRDLPDSAWVHFIYMVGALMNIGAYICSPMPKDVVMTTFWLMIAFVPVAIIEPGIVQGWPIKKKDVVLSGGIAIVLWSIIGLVTWIKLIHWWIF